MAAYAQPPAAPGPAPLPPAPKPTAELLKKQVQWYKNFENETSKSRGLSERDHDYYDGEQWTAAEESELKARGQPVVTYNRIAKTLNFILGYEVATRVDPIGLPRKGTREEDAKIAGDAIRYVTDEEDFNTIRSWATADILKKGYGGCIIECEHNGTDVDIKLRHVPWDRVWYDPHARKPDFSDSRYFGIYTWMDLEDAVAIYPDREANLRSAIDSSVTDETFGNRPDWYKTEERQLRICEVYWREGKQWYRADYTGDFFCRDPETLTYVDEKGRSICPLELTSAFVSRKNVRYGIIRGLISAQDEVNKRRSKALHLLNVRQFFYEEGVFKDPNKAAIELSKPDGKVEFNAGGLSENKFVQAQTGDLAQGHLALLQEAKAEIEALGPSIPPLAASGQNLSGRAVIERYKIGSMELQPVFENVRAWYMRVYRQIWYRVKQYWTYEKWFRVTDNKDGYRFVGINRPMTVGQRIQELIQNGMEPFDAVDAAGLQELRPSLENAAGMMMQGASQNGPEPDPVAVQMEVIQRLQAQPDVAARLQAPFTANDISQLGVDIVLDVVPDTSVIEQEEFDKLTELASTGFPIPPRVIIAASQLRDKKKILEMLDQPNPMQEEQQKLGLARMQATVGKIGAEAGLKHAQTAKIATEIQGAPAAAQLDQAKAALHTAQAAHMTVPEIPEPQNLSKR